MQILNVIRSVNPMHGGPAEGLRQSVHAMKALGHREEVLSLDDPKDAWVRDFPCKLEALGPVATRYGYTSRLVPWLEQHATRYDAIVVHGLWQYHGFAVRRAARRLGVPYFLFCHGMLDPWFKHEYPLKHLKKWLYWPWADYRVARDAKALLFTAEEEARRAPESFWLYQANPVVVGYGLTLQDEALGARAAVLFESFPELRHKRIVLHLGRLHPKKGCDLLIEAFAQVADDDPSLHLVMAGPDSAGYLSTLQALSACLGIAHRVTWTGMLQGELKWAALRAAEVLALPSHQENFGVAVAEALAVGTPVLISQRVNIWREIVEGGAGLAGPDTVEGATLLFRHWLAMTPEAQLRMRQLARDCFERHFQMHAAAVRLVDALSPHVKPRQGEPCLYSHR